jgi:hypothetical protein
MSTNTKDFRERLARDNAQNPRYARPLMRYYRDEIALALANGCSRKEVWSTLRAEGKINFRYTTFCRLARLLISETPPAIFATPCLH